MKTLKRRILTQEAELARDAFEVRALASPGRCGFSAPRNSIKALAGNPGKLVNVSRYSTTCTSARTHSAAGGRRERRAALRGNIFCCHGRPVSACAPRQ